MVFGNTANITSQKIEQITAQYVRLYVTRANRTNFESERDRCAICEFTVYGVKLGTGQATDWTLKDLSSKSEGGDSTVGSSSSNSNNLNGIGNTSSYGDISLEDGTLSESKTDTESELSSKGESKSSGADGNTKEKSGVGALIWIIIGVCALAVIGGAVVFIVIKKHKVN